MTVVSVLHVAVLLSICDLAQGSLISYIMCLFKGYPCIKINSSIFGYRSLSN